MRTPSRGTPVPEYISPDRTNRIARLEQQHDALAGVVADLRVAMGEVSGKLDAVLAHVVASHAEHAKTERARLGHRAKVIVGVVGALCAAAATLATALVSGCV